MNNCPNCGGSIIGDGYTVVEHCEFVELSDIMDIEPDAATVLCTIKENDELERYMG